MQLTRPLQGYLFLTNIPDTNTFLIAVEHYESDQKIAGCGALSTQVGLSFFPSIVSSAGIAVMRTQIHACIAQLADEQTPCIDASLYAFLFFCFCDSAQMRISL
jgi:hypothetical protein